jgi:AcrR family transcriptional regulator
VTLSLSSADIEAFRRRLTELATGLYLRGGEEGLTLRALAQEAGVSRTTPYSYFEDKDDILDSIRAAGFDRLTDRCAAALAAEPEVLARMRALGWAVVCFARAEPGIYQLMFSRPVFRGQLRPVLARAIERFRQVSRPPLDEAVRRGLVRGDPDTLRRVTWAAFHGLILLGLHGHLESERQLESDFLTLNEIIGFGILVDRDRTPTRKARTARTKPTAPTAPKTTKGKRR